MKLKLLREEANTLIQEGVPEFVSTAEELHQQAEPIIEARLRAASEYPLVDLTHAISHLKKRQVNRKSTSFISNADDDVVCTTPPSMTATYPYVYKAADGSFINAQLAVAAAPQVHANGNIPTTAALKNSMRLAINSDPLTANNSSATNFPKALVLATSTPWLRTRNSTPARSAPTRGSTRLVSKKRKSDLLNFGN